MRYAEIIAGAAVLSFGVVGRDKAFPISVDSFEAEGAVNLGISFKGDAHIIERKNADVFRGESSSWDEARDSTSLPYSRFVRKFSFFYD